MHNLIIILIKPILALKNFSLIKYYYWSVKSYLMKIENKTEILGPKFHFAFFWVVLVWLIRKQDVFQQGSDWFTLKTTITLIGLFGSTCQALECLFSISRTILVRYKYYIVAYCYKAEFVLKIMKHWIWEKKNFAHNKGPLGRRGKQPSWDHRHIQLENFSKISVYS